MLSDEEKKAVDELKKEINNPVEVPTDKFNTFILYNIESARTILNLIEKQSKEIEELKKDKLELINKNHVVHLKDVEKELREMKKVIDTKNAEIECLNVIHESYKEMVEENNFISKDKIKAKIEELKEDIKYSANPLSIDNSKFGIKVLQSLLEKE